MGVVPKKLSVRVYQTAGPEKERSQNRTGSHSEARLQSLEVIDIHR